MGIGACSSNVSHYSLFTLDTQTNSRIMAMAALSSRAASEEGTLSFWSCRQINANILSYIQSRRPLEQECFVRSRESARQPLYPEPMVLH